VKYPARSFVSDPDVSSATAILKAGFDDRPRVLQKKRKCGSGKFYVGNLTYSSTVYSPFHCVCSVSKACSGVVREKT
jgi:hypothetical protein